MKLSSENIKKEQVSDNQPTKISITKNQPSLVIKQDVINISGSDVNPVVLKDVKLKPMQAKESCHNTPESFKHAEVLLEEVKNEFWDLNKKETTNQLKYVLFLLL